MRLLPVAVHPYRAYLGLHAKFGDTFSARLPGGSQLVFTIDDALIEHVLVTHPTAFIRPRELVDSIFIPTVGDNVVASNGEAWATKRRTAEGQLDGSAWTTGFAALKTTVDELLADVRAVAGRGTADLLPAIERLVLGAAVRLVSGKQPAHGAPDFERFASAMAYVMRATQELGDVRKRGFLYSVLPRARDFLDGKRLAQLRRSVDEIAHFEPDSAKRELLLATYENPSTTLTWALQFLATEPAVRDRIRQEARTAFATHGPMTQEAIDSLEYTEAALREAARLRPAIAYLVREAIEDTTFAGVAIPRGTTITIVPYCVHMDERRWPDPKRYDPDRFVDGAEHPIRHRFLAFGVGPRACVGTRFAMRILKGALASLALGFDWSAPPKHALPEPSGRFPWSEKIACPLVVEAI
jgi:cytochrome P450